MLGDRYRRERVLLVTNLDAHRARRRRGASACSLDADPWVVYVLAVAATIATTPFRSAQAALTPSLARTPERADRRERGRERRREHRRLRGPALAGMLLAVASTGVVFLITALLVVVSTLFLVLIRIERAERPRRELEASTIAAEALAGFTTLGASPSLRVMIGLLTAQTAIVGAVQVFIVVIAIELLDLGDGGRRLPQRRDRRRRVRRRGRRALADRRSAAQPGVPRRARPLGRSRSSLLGLWPSRRRRARPASRSSASATRSSTSPGSRSFSAPSPTTFSPACSASSRCSCSRRWGSVPLLAPALIRWLGHRRGADRRPARSCRRSSCSSARRVARIDAAAGAPDADELRILGSVPIFAPLPGRIARAPRGAPRPAARRAGHGRSSARATPATASTSSPRARSRSRRTARRSPSSSAAATSARSHCCATCRAPRP